MLLNAESGHLYIWTQFHVIYLRSIQTACGCLADTVELLRCQRASGKSILIAFLRSLVGRRGGPQSTFAIPAVWPVSSLSEFGAGLGRDGIS